MKKPIKLLVTLVGAIGFALAFQNCSDVNFGQSSSSPNQSANGGAGGPGGAGGDAGGVIGQDGGGGGGNGGNGGPGDPNNPGGGGNGGNGPGDPNNPGGGGNGGTGPVNNPPGGTTPPGGTAPPGTPLAPVSIIPRVVFIGPPCVRGTNCLVAFELDQPYANRVDFDWRTNDTIWTTPSTPIYGKPNYHYVPTSGHITFMPGEIRKEVYVQNINPDNVSILIGIIMSNCNYGGAAHGCTQFFR